MKRELLIIGMVFFLLGLSFGQNRSIDLFSNNPVKASEENCGQVGSEEIESRVCEYINGDQAHIFKNNTKKFVEWFLPFRIEIIKRHFMLA